MEITKTGKINLEEKKTILEEIWKNQLTKIQENWGEKTTQDFLQQKKHLLEYCLQNLEDHYYTQEDKIPFIMVVPLIERLDVNKYLSIINKEGYFSSVRKDSVLSGHQKFPYFIIGIEIGQNNFKNCKKNSFNFIPPPKKGVNLEEMLAIAAETNIFEKGYIACTEAHNKKTKEIPTLGIMENRPILYWSNPELCLECGVPSKKRNFCSI